MEEKITKQDVIIAEFMGYKIQKDPTERFFGRYLTPITKVWINEIDLAFHHDWNWLMEVVEKIESLPTMKDNGNFFFEIHQDSVTVFNSTRMDIIIEVIGQGSRINNTYQAVIEFIQWYNKQNKNNEKHLHITDRKTK